MSNLNFVCVKADKTRRKFFAFTSQRPANHNLAGTFPFYDENIIIIHYMPSAKKAKETMDAWNAAYKANGTYMY